MKIEIDTTQPLTDDDKALLLALVGQFGGAPRSLPDDTDAPAVQTAEPPVAEEAPKPKRGRPRKTAEPKPELEDAPAVKTPDADTERAEVTKDDVAKRVLAMVESGQRDKAREILEGFGVSKVRELAEDQVAAVFAALDAA